MALMGWSSAAMAKRYQHPIDTVRRDVAEQLGGLWDQNDATQTANETTDADKPKA